MTAKGELREVAMLFFKLGCIAFGGPAAHIALMEEEVVAKRKWMEPQHFLDLMGATNIIPGPNSTEMTMHCGYERAGWKGLFVAGFCFIFPAVTITALLAWLYNKYGQLPEVTPFIYGIKPAVIVIIAIAAYRLGKKAFKNNTLIVLGILTGAACLLGFNEIAALFGCGALGLMLYFIKRKSAFFSITLFTLFHPSPTISEQFLRIFFIFLKIGAILYGSGYVLFAFLDAELVTTGWLTRQELMDAIAAGQMTPGPVLSTATFVGWQMGGVYGAVAATLGIFLPSFFLVWILNPLIPRIRKSGVLSAFLDAVNAASIALIIVVCIRMSFDTLTDLRTVLIAVISLWMMLSIKKWNSVLTIAGGATLGYILSFLPVYP